MRTSTRSSLPLARLEGLWSRGSRSPRRSRSRGPPSSTRSSERGCTRRYAPLSLSDSFLACRLNVELSQASKDSLPSALLGPRKPRPLFLALIKPAAPSPFGVAGSILFGGPPPPRRGELRSPEPLSCCEASQGEAS